MKAPGLTKFGNLLSRDIDIDPTVIQLIKDREHLRSRIAFLENPQDAENLYRDAATTLGTSTKKSIAAAAHPTLNIYIRNDFLVAQRSRAHFCHA